jgi:hypothetical protein
MSSGVGIETSDMISFLALDGVDLVHRFEGGEGVLLQERY